MTFFWDNQYIFRIRTFTKLLNIYTNYGTRKPGSDLMQKYMSLLHTKTNAFTDNIFLEKRSVKIVCSVAQLQS